MAPEAQKLTNLRDRLIKNVLQIEETSLNGHPIQRLPNNANFRFSYIEGEALVLLLSMKESLPPPAPLARQVPGNPVTSSWP